MVVQQTVTDSSAPGALPEDRLQPVKRTSFQDAMSAIASLRDRVGLSPELFDPAKWAESPLFSPVVRGLEWVKGSPFKRGVLLPLALGVTFGVNPEVYRELTAGGGPWLDRMDQANNVLSANPVGNYILNLIQTVSQYPTVIESNPLVKPENNAFLNATLGLGGIAQMFAIAYALGAVVQLVISRATMRAAQEQAREERMMRGGEPLPADREPAGVILGSVAALHAYLGCRVEKSSTAALRVLVFPENDLGQMSRLPEDTESNWRVAIPGPSALLDPQFRGKAGMDRAKEIVVFALDPNQVAFSGDSSRGYFSAEDCLVLLTQLAAQDKVPTKIKLIIPSGTSVGAAGSFRQICGPDSRIGRALQEKGATVDVVHPEDVVLAMIGEEVRKVTGDLTGRRDISICLVGNGNESTLQRMQDAIRLKVPGVGEVGIRHFSKGLKAFEGSPGRGKTRGGRGRPRKDNKNGEFHKEADLVIVYGQDDASTFALSATLNNVRGQKVALVETPDGSSHFASGEYARPRCIHTAINAKLGLTAGSTYAQ